MISPCRRTSCTSRSSSSCSRYARILLHQSSDAKMSIVVAQHDGNRNRKAAKDQRKKKGTKKPATAPSNDEQCNRKAVSSSSKRVQWTNDRSENYHKQLLTNKLRCICPDRTNTPPLLIFCLLWLCSSILCKHSAEKLGYFSDSFLMVR